MRRESLTITITIIALALAALASGCVGEEPPCDVEIGWYDCHPSPHDYVYPQAEGNIIPAQIDHYPYRMYITDDSSSDFGKCGQEMETAYPYFDEISSCSYDYPYITHLQRRGNALVWSWIYLDVQCYTNRERDYHSQGAIETEYICVYSENQSDSGEYIDFTRQDSPTYH